jgi:hypothetical protein
MCAIRPAPRSDLRAAPPLLLPNTTHHQQQQQRILIIQAYVQRCEELLGVPIVWIGVGPGRDAIVVKQ